MVYNQSSIGNDNPQVNGGGGRIGPGNKHVAGHAETSASELINVNVIENRVVWNSVVENDVAGNNNIHY